MHRVNVNFSKSQIKRLLKGHTVQVSSTELQKSSTIPILLNNKQFSTYKRALKMNKGMRFTIAPELMQENNMILGQGIMRDVIKSVGKTAKNVSKTVYKQALKPVGREMLKNLKHESKKIAIDMLQSDDPVKFVKDKKTLQRLGDFASSNLESGFNKTVSVSEKALEDALIENHGFPEKLAREIVSAGSHKLTKPVHDYLFGSQDEALEEIAVGAGLKKGVHYTMKGGRISFAKFLRGVKNVGQKILKVGKPILKPLAKSAVSAAVSGFSGPMGTQVANLATDMAYDKLAGSGKIKKGSQEMKAKMARVRAAKSTRGGALVPAGYRR